MKYFYYAILFLVSSLLTNAQDIGGTPISAENSIKRGNTDTETITISKTTINNTTAKSAGATAALTGTSQEVGITEGQLSVSLSGGAGYVIPIAVPPGINNVVPKISLAYNSMAGNGLAGYGWNISGVSAITRIPRTKFHDNAVGGVNLDANDRFALDGQRLILKSGVYGANNTEYETENFSNVKIKAIGVSPLGANYGPASFLVEYPDGSKAEYGASTDSRSITAWGITYWENAQGVRISYNYLLANNNLSVEYIKYGSTGVNTPINQIRFVYKIRERPEQSYVAGQSILMNTILSEIKTIGNGIGFRNYVLDYDVNLLAYERLKSITEKSGDASKSYNPTVFSYGETPLSLTKSRINIYNTEEVSIVKTESVSGDFDGDGFMDYLLYPKDSKTKITIYNDLRNASALGIGYPVNIGFFQDIFPSTWLMANGKISSRQGITAVHPVTSPQGNIAFKTYSFSAPFLYQPVTRIVNFPTYTRSAGCKEFYSGNQVGCQEITEEQVISKKYLSGDFNGDGLTDVIAIDNSGYSNLYCDSNDNNGCYTYGGDQQYYPNQVYFIDLNITLASNYLKNIGTLQNKITYASDVRVIDFNGDGRSDFMIRENGSIFVYTMSQTYGLVLLTSKTDADIFLNRKFLVGDYNGDGKTDFITPKFAENSTYHTEWYKFTSNGTNFVKEEQNYPQVNYQAIVNSNSHYIPMDYDNDGKTDIVALTCYLPPNTTANYVYVKFAVAYNKNGVFNYTENVGSNAIFTAEEVGFDYLSLPIFYSSNQPNRKLEIALMRNDKIIYFQSQKDFSIDKLLKSITTGNGVKESITYKSLVYDISEEDVSVYTSVPNISSYPNTDILTAPSFQVVSMFEKESATVYKKQLFSYTGATFNLEGMGFLGFRATMRTNWFDDYGKIISSISKFDPNLRGANTENYTYEGLISPEVTAYQSAVNMNRPSTVIVDYSVIDDYDTVLATKSIKIVPGVTIAPGGDYVWIARITPDYDSTGFAETNTSPPYGLISKSLSFYETSLSPTKVYKSRNIKSNSYNILENTSTETTTEYDAYNNPTESITKLKNGGITEQTTTSSITYAIPYTTSRPISKTQTVTSSGDSMSTKETYGYGTGTESNLLKKIEKWGNNTNSIREENVYDVFGNITKKTITAGSESRITDYEYNPASPYNGRFLTKSTDVERLSTMFTYNANNGLLDSETNPYNLTTTYLYDSWFKKTRKTDYLGKYNTYSYTRSGNVNTLVTTTGDSDGSKSEELFDDLGRKIRTGIKDIQGNMFYKDFKYDIYDRNYSTSEPHTGSASLWSTTEYDLYSRPQTVTNFTGKVVNITYDKLITTVTDGSTGNIKTATKNAIGNVITMTEAPIGGTINYTYFANGNLKETNYSGNKISITQDGWGRKTSLTDPSAGTYSYKYNALGEQTEETTPNGTTVFNLESTTGKLTSKTIVGTNTNTSTVYTYNALPDNKMLQKTVYTDVGDGNKTITTEFTYDAQKRLVTTKEITGYGAEFTKTIGYDNWGRVNAETSEAKLNSKTSTTGVKHNYKNGYAYSMENSSNTVVYYKTDEVNSRGQLKKGTLGNGIVINNTYDANDFGYLANTKHSLGTITTMELSTDFNVQRGNLMSRTNSLFGTSEVFEYDNQDRLTKYPNALGVQVSQTYEDDGRIKANTLGTYNYANTAKKYQNTSITLSPEATGYYANREGIYNDSMEDSSGWALTDSNISFDKSTPAHSGNTSLKITNVAGVSERVIHANSWVKINNTVPTEYTYSAWVKSDGPQAEIFLFMKTENEIAYFTQIDNKVSNTVNQWTQITGTFMVPANIKRLNIRLDNNGTGSVWYDDVMIRKTNNTALVDKEIPDSDYKDRQLNITYNTFKSPVEIREAGIDKISFTYNDNNNRSVMFYGSLDATKHLRPIHKHYSADGTMEIKHNIQTGEIEFVTYMGGDGYSAPLIYKKSYNSGGISQDQILYLHRDYQGSILAITNQAGTVLEKRLFDAWGTIVSVQDGAGNVLNGLTILDRGYTGHEHLQSVGLIHMNGRLYDSKLHRFLQADNYVQDPTNPQNFNRYGYCINNPLKYTDKNGEWFGLDDLVVAAFSFAIGYVSSGLTTGDWGWKSVQSGLISAVTGWIAYNTLGASTFSDSCVSGNVGMWNFIGSSAASAAIGAFMPPVGIPIGDWTVSISPSIAFGNVSGVGASLSVTYSSGDFSFSGGIGIMSNSNYNGFGKNGLEIRKSILMSYDDGRTGFSLGTNFWSGTDGMKDFTQRTGVVGLHFGDFRAMYENDGGLGISQSRLGDRNDSFRTAALNLSVGEFSAGFNLFTGQRSRTDQETEEASTHSYKDRFGVNHKNAPVNEIGTKYRLGALTFGYGGYRVGVNSEHIRHAIQNSIIHRAINDNEFTNTSWYWKGYVQYKTSNIFTSW
nr:polymorphic toxin type 23 domain-containing protein [uncultured Flavobacterium sp.]